MNHALTALCVAAALAFVACEKKKEPVPTRDLKRYEAEVTDGEKELQTYDSRIKEMEFDPGAKDRLAEDRELLKSRLERLKEKLKIERRLSGFVEEAKPESSH